jgi:hypothetical protein
MFSRIMLIAFLVLFAGIAVAKPPQAGFKGPWNKVEATKIVQALLPKKADKDGRKYSYRILGDYELKYSGGSTFIVAVARDEEDACHACPARVSLFEFAASRAGEGWDLREIEWKAFDSGDWGKADDSIAALQMGDKAFGLINEGCGGMSGIEECWRHIFFKIGGKWRKVFSEQMSERNVGTSTPVPGWSATMALEPSGGPMHDIVLTATGEGAEWLRRVFKFDRKAYVEQKTGK